MFYDRFYALCEKYGVTPTQLAREIGINQSTVSMWKKQGTTPKYETLQKISDYFGVTILALLGPEQELKWYQAGVRLAFNVGENKVLTAFRRLNDKGQAKAIERVEELTEIPRYRATEAPQPPQQPPEGTDTTLPENGSEKPPEGQE